MAKNLEVWLSEADDDKNADNLLDMIE
jgi:hypothetical protein